MKRVATLLTDLVFALALMCCQRDDHAGPKYYMSATIDGYVWEADKDYAWAQLEYNFNAAEHDVEIYSQNSKLLEDGIRYQIGLYINYPPAKGVYKFNNIGPDKVYANNAAADVHGWRSNGTDDFFVSYSIDGQVEITEITKEFIKGSFEYNAVTAKDSNSSASDTIRVRNGKFYIPINVVSGKKWEGPR